MNGKSRTAATDAQFDAFEEAAPKIQATISWLDGFARCHIIGEGNMVKLWSREHLERRIDRCYLLAAATKMPAVRTLYLGRARDYRRQLRTLQPMAT